MSKSEFVAVILWWFSVVIVSTMAYSAGHRVGKLRGEHIGYNHCLSVFVQEADNGSK